MVVVVVEVHRILMIFPSVPHLVVVCAVAGGGYTPVSHPIINVFAILYNEFLIMLIILIYVKSFIVLINLIHIFLILYNEFLFMLIILIHVKSFLVLINLIHTELLIPIDLLFQHPIKKKKNLPGEGADSRDS